ncbi:MAG: cytochrome c [Cyclobacteriaceae bacterium]
MMNLSRTLILVLSLAMFSCSTSGNKNASGEALSNEEQVRLEQYMVQGMSLYRANCANCHGMEGQGLARLYPPLAGSDYLLEDLERAACLIRNGQKGEITVNGITYNRMMPANKSLDPIEIAEIITYVSNSWGNEAELTSVSTVSKWLLKCENK